MLKEIWISKSSYEFKQICPLCKEKSCAEHYMVLGTFYCENPDCFVVRFSDEGYYQISEDGQNLDVSGINYRKRSN
jgi:hypothetical protein